MQRRGHSRHLPPGEVDRRAGLAQFAAMRALILLLGLLLLAPAARAGQVLDRVRQNDVVRCAAAPEQPGFAMPEGRTGYNGFDVDICRAVAAAVLGDPGKMQFTPLAGAARLAALKDGTIDLDARSGPTTLSRALDPELLPVGTSFRTGLGFMVKAQTNIVTFEALNSANFCLRRDPETHRLLTDELTVRNFKFRLSEFDSFAEALRNFYAARCDALVGQVVDLATARVRTDNPAYYRIGRTYLTLDEYGPVVLRADAQWAEIVRWTLQALIATEAANVSKFNLQASFSSQDRHIRWLLGRDGDPGAPLGLPANWIARVLDAVGNYGEIYDRDIGPLALPRGPNDMWFRQGTLTAPALQ